MDKTSTFPADYLVHIHHEIQIDAPVAVVYDSVLEQLGPGGTMPDGKSMQMRLEPWPGGRWFRDLGNNTGHLWGHVQVIKPPTLIELTGPLFMSYAVTSHVQYRLTEKADGTGLSFTHRAIGEITPEHRQGMTKGWEQILSKIKERATR